MFGFPVPSFMCSLLGFWQQELRYWVFSMFNSRYNISWRRCVLRINKRVDQTGMEPVMIMYDNRVNLNISYPFTCESSDSPENTTYADNCIVHYEFNDLP